MKKILYIVSSLILFVSFLSACDPSIAASTSENIQYVSASYHMVDNLNEPNDRLLKSAELIYTNMYVTPDGAVSVTRISFDAKLKSGSAADLIVNVYAVDNALQQIEKKLVQNYQLKLSEESNNFKIDITSIDLKSVVDKNTGDYGLRIEFLNTDGTPNHLVCFSLNNIKLN